MLGLWDAFKLWGGFGRIGTWLAEALRYLLAHPATAAAIVFAILWRVDAHELATKDRALAQCQRARKATAAAGEKAAATSKTVSETNSAIHQSNVTANRALAAGYLAAHRVPVAATGGRGGEDHGPALSAEPAAGPWLVTISEPDYGACTDWVSYGQGANGFLTDLIAKGLAQPAER